MAVNWEDIFRSQKGKVFPITKVSLIGKVIVVIGANSGLGFEAAKHFATMKPKKLILGCRSEERGLTALKKIKAETGCATAELGIIDLTSFASIEAFCNKVNDEVDRLDLLILNAGVSYMKYTGTTEDGFETTLQTNNLGPEFLALLLLPKMIKTGKMPEYRTPDARLRSPRLVFLTSHVYSMTSREDLECLKSREDIHQALSKEEYCTDVAMGGRYSLSKLLTFFFARELQSRLPSVIVTLVGPGLCASGITRHLPEEYKQQLDAMTKQFGLSTEMGSRQILLGALAVPEEGEQALKGAYISSGEIIAPGPLTDGEDSIPMRKRVWEDMIRVIGKVDKEGKAMETVRNYLSEHDT